MRKLLVVLCLLAVVVIAGCGGGGGGTTTATATLDMNGATPSNGGVTVSHRSAIGLPGAPVGQAFIAGAVFTPVHTTFSSPVILTFNLTTPIPAGATLGFLKGDSGGNWTSVSDAVINVSSDRLTVTVQFGTDIADFNGDAYMLTKS